jgi:RHS repeat-associated protein
LQTKTCPEGTTSYDYDAFGNLRHVTLPNGTAIDYLVDGQNRRIGKKVNGVMVEGFLYRNQLQPAAWLNGDGTVRARFIYGGKPNVPEYMVTSAGATYRLITDQVGSVRLVVDASSGAVVERIDWDEFGNVLADGAPGTQPFGFAGGLRDLDTGLTRFGARGYDPVTGRWTRKDSEGLQGGLNPFEYGANDPINHIDPSGDDWTDWDLSGAANFAAGMGDNLSFGLTSFIRQQMGVDDVVDKCSGLYSAGEWTGIALSTAIGAAAGAKAAGGKAAGREFSHWLPNRWGGPRSILNGNWVTTAEHALNDPYRYRFMNAAWKAANPMNPAWLQQSNRIPLLLKGAGAGAAYGGASAAAGGRCGCGG